MGRAGCSDLEFDLSETPTRLAVDAFDLDKVLRAEARAVVADFINRSPKLRREGSAAYVNALGALLCEEGIAASFDEHGERIASELFGEAFLAANPAARGYYFDSYVSPWLVALGGEPLTSEHIVRFRSTQTLHVRKYTTGNATMCGKMFKPEEVDVPIERGLFKTLADQKTLTKNGPKVCKLCKQQASARSTWPSGQASLELPSLYVLDDRTNKESRVVLVQEVNKRLDAILASPREDRPAAVEALHRDIPQMISDEGRRTAASILSRQATATRFGSMLRRVGHDRPELLDSMEGALRAMVRYANEPGKELRWPSKTKLDAILADIDPSLDPGQIQLRFCAHMFAVEWQAAAGKLHLRAKDFAAGDGATVAAIWRTYPNGEYLLESATAV